jgi:hypothetical protein
MRYWPTINTNYGKVGTLVELPNTAETMILVREGLMVPEVTKSDESQEEDPSVLLW